MQNKKLSVIVAIVVAVLLAVAIGYFVKMQSGKTGEGALRLSGLRLSPFRLTCIRGVRLPGVTPCNTVR